VGRVLEKHEFQSVKLESLHFNKQLRLLANAEVICGPHGAGLVNMIFADEPDIVEILPDSDIRPHFYYLSDMLDLDYHPLIADTREKDMTVDTTQLDRLLTRIID
jgi:capsular polysaccharide biosynthesis protein